MIEHATHDARIVMARHHQYRDAGILPAQRCESGKALAARHVQVEQHQVDVRLRRQHSQRTIEIGRFAHVAIGHAFAGCLAQRGTKQRMVVGNQQACHGRRR